MCGRYTLTAPLETIFEHFQGIPIPFPLEPRYNIAPTQNILAIKKNRKPGLLRWGLIPPWAKDTSIGNKMINARAETVAEKPSFKSALKSRRCLIPADGFYEWKKEGTHKQPYHIRKCDRSVFCFAGLWEQWKSKGSAEQIESCTIITTAANEQLKPLHDRMPVIIPLEAYDQWINNESIDQLLLPYEWPDFEMVKASPFVNNANHEGPQCLENA